MSSIIPGQYGLIYADPAWEFVLHSKKGEKKSPQAHYDCMSKAELEDMRDDVLFATGPNCFLVMWATFPMLLDAISLMKVWGFEYVTGGAWQKVTKHGKKAFGTGYVLRGSSELFLIGKFGAPKVKNKKTRGSLVTGDVPDDLRLMGVSLFGPLRENSRKPDEMYPVIEELFEGPYLELFARSKRQGWDSWGNQTTKFGEVA